jgi:hypothetical protein
MLSDLGFCKLLGFVPVAVNTALFQTLIKIGKPVSVADIVEAVAKDDSTKSFISKTPQITSQLRL